VRLIPFSSLLEFGLTMCVCRPVAFERDTADPFEIDAFLESAKAPAKRGLDTGKGDDGARKRARD
jgi:hypothetical protein